MTIINVSRAELHTGITLIASACASSSSIPLLSHVLIGDIDGNTAIRSTDLESQATYKLDGCSTGQPLTLPFKALAQVEKNAPQCERVSVSRNGDNPAQIDFENLKIKMESLDPTEWPELDRGKPHFSFDIDTTDLALSLDQLSFAISTEETRYYLNGICMHHLDGALEMAATDGHRLSRVRMPGNVSDGMPKLILPRAAVAFLEKALKTKGMPATTRIDITRINAGDDTANIYRIVFTMGRLEFVTKVIDGTYPDYQRVIPTEFKRVGVFGRLDAIKALKSVGTITSERGKAVACSFSDNKLTFKTNNPDIGSAELSIQCAYEGRPIDIGFSSKYLLEMLTHIKSDDVVCELNDEGSPTRFHVPEGDDNLFVQMPMRV